MLFYFSGTGNSEFVATTLANFLNLKKYFIPSVDPEEFTYIEDKLVFVFPVYSWGVPPLIDSFLLSLPQSFYESANLNNINIDCIMVCGDEVALAPEMFNKLLKKVNLTLNSIWSIIMPNNYVLLPGFDVDSKSLEQKKLTDCKGRILEIAQALQRGDRIIDVTRGKMAWLKTKCIFPFFKRWGIFPKKWRYGNTCISCGKCAKVCPMVNVKMENGHPIWGSRCCSCLSCYHVCPVHSVEYGSFTSKKGQYWFPLKQR